jgi:hypothetical protein
MDDFNKIINILTKFLNNKSLEGKNNIENKKTEQDKKNKKLKCCFKCDISDDVKQVYICGGCI